ncbi:PHB depolymerase family esterase [Tumidithrix helvetica PCC 7403]|uniref:alpha/beta hydrolase family esterase n=1 Tax=Tumidithrix helvetica TaxID=3457545 RepID=UPI003C9053FB
MLRQRWLERKARLFDRRQLFHQGLKRTYALYTPPIYKDENSLPLVLGFHGGYTLASRFAITTGLNDLADEKKFLVVYPQGIDSHWNDGRGTTNPQIDDVGFVEALIHEIQNLRNIDSRRIYVTGISNGGYFVQRLACQLPQKIAAFASVAATLPVPLRDCRQGQLPVSILMINSPNDTFVPWEGGIGTKGKGGEILSVPATVEFWRQHNGCSSIKETQLLGDNVEMMRYSGRNSEVEVILVTVKDGGHTWPGGKQQPQWLVGKTTKEIQASYLIWDFFQRHTLH